MVEGGCGKWKGSLPREKARQENDPRSHGESQNEESGDGVGSPIQETSNEHAVQVSASHGDQDCGLVVSVEETGQPNSHGMPPCYLRGTNDDINAVCSTHENEQAIEHACSIEDFRLWNQRLNRWNTEEKTMKKASGTGTYFILEITEVDQHKRFGTPIFSDAIYTDSYARKLGIRVHPKGVENGSGTHVAVFVHIMKGKYDGICDWPFPGRIALSILDQSGAHNDTSRILQVKPNLAAFQRPDGVISRTGYGFVKFSPIEEFFGPQYVKDDTMFIKIEFSA